MFVPQAQSGTDTHVLIHAQVEEFLTLSVANVFAPLVIGMAHHASSAQTLKFGLLQDCHVFVPKETGMESPASTAQPIKSGSQPQCNAVAQEDKTGMDFHVSLAQLDKTGMLPRDHVDAQLDKTGMEKHVFHVLVEDNGMLSQDNVYALLETGMASPAFNVLLDKLGTHQVFHAHAHQVLFGTASTAECAQGPADFGISNLMIVSAEQETGTELNVSFVQSTATGMEELA